jgi:hypothetical protein
MQSMMSDFPRFGRTQMLRISVGTLFVLFGLTVAVFAAAFVQGPVFYWADPIEAPALKTHGTIVGAAALLLGAILIGSGLLKARRAKPRSSKEESA